MSTPAPAKAVIFDMDGVIVDSEPLHERAFREVFHEMGYGETHGVHFPNYFGRSDFALWNDFIATHNPPQPIEHLTEWKQSRFIEILRRDQPIFPPLPGLVEKLSRHFKLAVASGSFHKVIDEVLAMRDLRRFFPVVVSVEDVKRGKPAPDVFLRAAELIGCEPASCWVIEDSAAGVQAAVSAGVRVIAITNSLPASQLALANHIVSDYRDIEKILLS